MARSITWFTACIALGFLTLVVVAHADEEKVPLDKVPKPVLEAVKNRFKDAKLTGASKETEEGKLVYEVTIQHRGQHIDVTLTPEGEIVMIEKEIAAKGLPQRVTKVLKDKHPKATYKIVEEIIKVEKKQERLAYYEVLLVTADKKKIEVQVAPNGKIVNEEKKDAEKDDK